MKGREPILAGPRVVTPAAEVFVLTIGLDATRGGWVAVALTDGRFSEARCLPAAPRAVERWPEAAAIGIDIPIGLLDEPRAADVAARRALGRRAGTVFLAPCASAIAQPTYAEANRVQRACLGAGLSAQSFALKERIVDAARVAADPRVHEVHPELVFARLAGRPLPSKRTWNGQHARRAALATRGLHLPDDLGAAGAVPADDLLDAAAVALAALDILAGRSPSFPAAPTQRDPSGRLVSIRG